MLIGIIKNDTTNTSYYINLDKKNNTNLLSIIETSKNSIKALTRDEAINLYRTLLSSKLTYKEKYNDYDVYLDEANNKRYIKGDSENIRLFLENNGVSAILCFEKNKKTSNITKAYKIITTGIGLTIIFSSISLIPVADDTRFFKGTEYALSSAVPLTSTEAINLINNSLYLSQEEKEHFANKDYFDFVLSHTESKDREYYLRNSLNNTRIKHYDQDFFPTATGYYNPLDINAINVCNTVEPNTPEYIDVLSHEFVHLTQDQNKYLYIIEATAEIMEYEFYNQPCDGYKELVKRTRALMEIIGPEPVASCVYSGDTKYFENSIKEYLNEEDSERLLNLFTASAEKLYESVNSMNAVNIEIDSLLGKMYFNKTGKPIYEDHMIRLIYAIDTDERIYFNSNLEKYNDYYYLMSDREPIDKLDMNYIINADIVETYTYSTKSTRQVDGRTTEFYGRETTNDFKSIVLEDQQILTIEFKDGSRGITIYDAKSNSFSPVDHYRLVELYEPPIYEKFPDQIKNPINVKEYPEKEICEAKSI